MYNTFSHTFTSSTHGDKKFYFTASKRGAGQTYEGKINDDKTVKKFQMKQDENSAWKIQPQKLPEWVLGLEQAFHDKIEEKKN